VPIEKTTAPPKGERVAEKKDSIREIFLYNVG
jgi:hypothetical protein